MKHKLLFFGFLLVLFSVNSNLCAQTPANRAAALRTLKGCATRPITLGCSEDTAGYLPSPQELVGSDIDLSEFQVENARDTVVVGQFSGGGLISYRKKDGTYLHTLNTVAGFERKLSQLGIKL